MTKVKTYLITITFPDGSKVEHKARGEKAKKARLQRIMQNLAFQRCGGVYDVKELAEVKA